MASKIFKEKGAVLCADFDKSSPDLKKDLKAFEKQLAEIQKKEKIEGFVVAQRETAKLLEVRVVAARGLGPATVSTAKAATASIQKKLGWSSDSDFESPSPKRKKL